MLRLDRRVQWSDTKTKEDEREMKIIAGLVLSILLMLGVSTPAKAELGVSPVNFNHSLCSPGLIVISGRVTNAAGAGIARATLSITDISQSVVCDTAVTNSFGYYTFDPVFTDSMLIQVSAPRYQPDSAFVSGVEDQTVNFVLSE